MSEHVRVQWRPSSNIRLPDGQWGSTSIQTRHVPVDAPPAQFDGWFEGLPPRLPSREDKE